MALFVSNEKSVEASL